MVLDKAAWAAELLEALCLTGEALGAFSRSGVFDFDLDLSGPYKNKGNYNGLQ